MGISCQPIQQKTTKHPKMKSFIALVAIANADSVSHASVKYGHSEGHSHAVSHAPTYHSAPAAYQPARFYAPVYHHAAPLYQYGYAATDDYSGVNFAANEQRDGYSTSGEYRVNLPDCRTQIVKYHTADDHSGNVVEVTYEGTPCYPEAKYKAAPVYKAPVASYKAHA